MRGILISIDAWNRRTSTRVTVRIGAARNSSTLGAGGLVWQSVMRRAPRLSMQLCDDDLTGTLMVGQGEFSFKASDLRDVSADDLDWIGSPVTILSGDGPNMASYRTEFVGRVTAGATAAEDGIASLNIAVDRSMVDVPLLLASYGGGGGLDGDVELRGNPKPAGYGAPINFRPPCINTVLQIYQIDAYGNTQSIAGVYENLASFGASKGDYANYAALAAAPLKEGEWATCIAQGLFRLGATATGTITCDAVFGANLPGSMMLRWIRAHAGVAESKIRVSDFDSLTASVQAVVGTAPTVSLWTMDDQNVLDLLQRMAASCNASLLLMLDGRIGVARAIGGAVQLTLERQGGVSRVVAWRSSDPPVPWWRLKMPAARSWYVNPPGEIDYEDDIRDMGDYSPTETYRQGMVVRASDGARYLYQSPTPGSGVAPPDGEVRWTLYEEAVAGANAFTLRNVLNCDNPGPNFIVKRSGGNVWNGKARTAEGGPAATVSGVMDNNTFIGLTTDPDVVASDVYLSIDYGLHVDGSRIYYVFRNGNVVYSSQGPGAPPTARFQVSHDGVTVRYYVNGAMFYSHPVNAAGEIVFGSFAIAFVDARVTDITYQVGGAVGAAGQDGASQFNLLNVGNTVLTPNSVRAPGIDGWDGKARTQESYIGAVVSAMMTVSTGVGLDINPTQNLGYDTVDYWLHRSASGVIALYRNGNFVDSVPDPNAANPITPTGPFTVACDGKTVRYFHAGSEIALFRHAANGTNELLFGVFNLASSTAAITSISFANAGLAGIDGKSAYNAILSNDPHQVAAGVDGTVLSYAGAATSVQILFGATDVTSSFTAAIAPGGNPQGLTLGGSYPNYTLTSGFDANEDVASITFRFTGSGAHAGVIVDKTWSFSKSKAPANGVSPPLIQLSATSRFFSYDTNGAIRNASITISAVQTNAPDVPPQWRLLTSGGTPLSGWYTADQLAPNGAASSYNDAFSINIGDGFFDGKITANAARGLAYEVRLPAYPNVTDRIDIVKVSDGAPGQNAIVGFLSNESHTVAADKDGNVTSYAGADGGFRVFFGLTDVSGGGGVTYSTVDNPQGLTRSGSGNLIDSNGYYRIDAGFDAVEASAVATLRATYQGVSIDKRFSLSKSKSGANGEPAKTLTLTTTAQTAPYDGANVFVGSDITFSVRRQAVTSPADFEVCDLAGNNLGWGPAPTPDFTTSNSTYFQHLDYDNLVMKAAGVAHFLADRPGFMIRVTNPSDRSIRDQVSVMRVKDGANAVSGLLTNESHTLPAGADGTVVSYARAEGVFRVFNGGTDVTGAATFYATLDNPQGLTRSGGPALIDANGFYRIDAGFDPSEPSATVTLRAVYGGVTIDKVFTLAKSKDGSNGLNAKILYVTSPSQQITLDAAGALAPPSAQQSITFTANKQNTTAAVTWDVYDQGGTRRGGGSGDTYSMTGQDILNVITAGGATATQMVVVGSMADGTPPDRISVSALRAGADALTFDLSTTSIKIAANAAGVPKDNQLPQQVNVRVRKGNTDVTSAAGVGISAPSGITASYSNGVVNVTAASASGSITLTATYQGVPVGAPKTVEVQLNLDAAVAGPNSVSGKADGNLLSGSAGNTWSDAAGSQPLILTVGPAGQARMNAFIAYATGFVRQGTTGPRMGSLIVRAKLQYRANGTSAWMDITSGADGTEATYYSDADTQTSEGGQLTIAPVTVSGLTSGQAYDFRVAYMRSDGVPVNNQGIVGNIMVERL